MRDAPRTYEFIDVKLKRALELPGEVTSRVVHFQPSNLDTIFINVSRDINSLSTDDRSVWFFLFFSRKRQ